MLINCSLCNKEFKRHPSKINWNKRNRSNKSFCSKGCAVKYNTNLRIEKAKISRECGHCGSVFNRRKCDFNANEQRGYKNYCSKDCKFKAQSIWLIGNKNAFGLRHSEETKRKYSLDRAGKNNPMYGIPSPIKGKKLNLSEEEIARRRAPRLNYRGKNHPNWKGGKTAPHKLFRASSANRTLIKSAFERDNHTCQICGDKKGPFNGDHMMPFSILPKKDWLNLDNIRTLCVPCHKKYGANPQYKPQRWAISPVDRNNLINIYAS